MTAWADPKALALDTGLAWEGMAKEMVIGFFFLEKQGPSAAGCLALGCVGIMREPDFMLPPEGLSGLAALGIDHGGWLAVPPRQAGVGRRLGSLPSSLWPFCEGHVKGLIGAWISHHEPRVSERHRAVLEAALH